MTGFRCNDRIINYPIGGLLGVLGHDEDHYRAYVFRIPLYFFLSLISLIREANVKEKKKKKKICKSDTLDYKHAYSNNLRAINRNQIITRSLNSEWNYGKVNLISFFLFSIFSLNFTNVNTDISINLFFLINIY